MYSVVASSGGKGGGGGGGEGGEVWVCRGREIFYAYINGLWIIFDGLQNTFLYSFVILAFSKFIWKIVWVWAENVQTGHQKDLSKIRHVKEQIKSFEPHDNKS